MFFQIGYTCQQTTSGIACLPELVGSVESVESVESVGIGGTSGIGGIGGTGGVGGIGAASCQAGYSPAISIDGSTRTCTGLIDPT